LSRVQIPPPRPRFAGFRRRVPSLRSALPPACSRWRRSMGARCFSPGMRGMTRPTAPAWACMCLRSGSNSGSMEKRRARCPLVESVRPSSSTVRCTSTTARCRRRRHGQSQRPQVQGSQAHYRGSWRERPFPSYLHARVQPGSNSGGPTSSASSAVGRPPRSTRRSSRCAERAPPYRCSRLLRGFWHSIAHPHIN
jgi:hypothetical protein